MTSPAPRPRTWDGGGWGHEPGTATDPAPRDDRAAEAPAAGPRPAAAAPPPASAAAPDANVATGHAPPGRPRAGRCGRRRGPGLAWDLLAPADPTDQSATGPVASPAPASSARGRPRTRRSPRPGRTAPPAPRRAQRAPRREGTPRGRPALAGAPGATRAEHGRHRSRPNSPPHTETSAHRSAHEPPDERADERARPPAPPRRRPSRRTRPTSGSRLERRPGRLPRRREGIHHRTRDLLGTGLRFAASSGARVRTGGPRPPGGTSPSAPGGGRASLTVP